MFGYIYKTTNRLNGMMYIGKHKWPKFDESYYGSGKVILEAIEKHGIENFDHEMLVSAESKEELDAAEMRLITEYRQKYGDKMYNQAAGGDGGDVFRYADDDTRKAFVEKMTQINRTRCNTEEFKDQARRHILKRWEDPDYQKKMSEFRSKMWEDPKYRENHIQKLKEFYKEHPKDNSYFNKRTLLVVNKERLLFASQQYALKYLEDKYNFHLCRPSLRKLERISWRGGEYRIFHYNKFPGLKTLQIFYIRPDDKGVETRADECKPVSLGIGARLKCATDSHGIAKLEEIVQPVQQWANDVSDV